MAATTLRDLTTLRLGGPAAAYLEPPTTADLADVVADLDADRTPVLLVGGGSNLVVADEGWPGAVVRIVTRGTSAETDGDHVDLQVAAGEPWEDLVARTVEEGWVGLEALAGIPGLTGATPVQNVGAYGAEIADLVVAVDVWDREEGDLRVLPAAACRFGYRTSVFKHSERWVVLGVTLRLRRSAASAPVRYAELARTLGVEVGTPAPAADVRAAVLDLRRGKGMVLDPDDHDTWSAGSFFTNPIVPEAPEGAPAWPADGGVKTSAAWLIEHAGFHRGFSVGGPVSLSTKHTLALTNRGGARTEDLLRLARTVRDGVRSAYGIDLQPEPRLVGCSL